MIDDQGPRTDDTVEMLRDKDSHESDALEIEFFEEDPPSPAETETDQTEGEGLDDDNIELF